MNKLPHKIILFFAFLGLFIVCAGWSDGVREERSVTPVSFNLSPHEALLITYDTTVGTEHRYYARIYYSDGVSQQVPLISQRALSILQQREGNIYYLPAIGERKQLFDNIRELFHTTLHNGDTVYMLLNGDISNLAIEAIPSDSDDIYLCDRYTMNRISSLQKFYHRKQSVTTERHQAILFGDMTYNDPKLKNLEGSKKAIAYNRDLFANYQLDPAYYTLSDATTEAFFSISGRQADNILISTHGETRRQADLSSVYELIFHDSYGIPVTEIARMDFSNIRTILVTACHSGRYDSREELCLQSAFKRAGANSIIMHLWRTNDKAAELFMKAYYTAWLSGQTPHEAFLAAKSAVRQVMEEPLYWAGFIMLD